MSYICTPLPHIKQLCSLGNEEKLRFCKDLGADVCINYKTEDFVARVKEETGGKGEISQTYRSIKFTYYVVV